MGRPSGWTCTNQGPHTAYVLCLLRAAYHWQRSIAVTTGNTSDIANVGKRLPLVANTPSSHRALFHERVCGASSARSSD